MAQKRVDFVITEKGASKAKQGFNSVDNSIKSAAKSAAMYAAAYIGVRGIISLTKQAIEAFGVQEQAEKRLSVATGRNTDALLKQASALQQVTTFGDEMIIGVQASLAAFAESDEEIKRLTVATLDLAAATGMDLKAAGDLIAKSYGSSTNALSRYGIEVTGVANSTERLDTLTGNIAARFEGQASAAADTMAGSMEQAKNAVGDLAEDMGGFLAPVVTDVARGIKGLVEGLQEFIALSEYQNDVLETSYESQARLRTEFDFLALRLSGLQEGTTLYNETLAQLNLTAAEYAGVLAEINSYEQGLADSIYDDVDALIDMDDAIKNVTASSHVMFSELEPAMSFTEMQAEKTNAVLDETSAAALAMSDDLKGSSISLAQSYIVEGVVGYMKNILASYPPYISLPLAIGGGIAAKAAFNSIMPAATGADFITDGPQLMMVGEAGREKVQVTPLEGPNIDGPQGSVVINFNAPVTDRQFVRSYILPEIQKAVRLNA